jgi:hypothetical protein
MINVIGAVKQAALINQTLANNLGAAIKTAVTSTSWNLALAPDVHLTAVGVRDISLPNLAEFTDSSGPASGAATDDQLPGGNAVAVTLRTAKAGQSFRGRVFLGGLSELSNDATGQIAAPSGSAAVAFVAAIQAAITGQGMQMAVISRPSLLKTILTQVFNADGTVASAKTTTEKARGGAVTPVTAIVLRNNIWDSQRRRNGPGSASTFRQPLHKIDVAPASG